MLEEQKPKHPPGFNPPCTTATRAPWISSHSFNHMVIPMRKIFSELANSIIKTLGLFNRTVNAADALVETAEAQALAFRDEELEKLK